MILVKRQTFRSGYPMYARVTSETATQFVGVVMDDYGNDTPTRVRISKRTGKQVGPAGGYWFQFAGNLEQTLSDLRESKAQGESAKMAAQWQQAMRLAEARLLIHLAGPVAEDLGLYKAIVDSPRHGQVVLLYSPREGRRDELAFHVSAFYRSSGETVETSYGTAYGDTVEDALAAVVEAWLL